MFNLKFWDKSYKNHEEAVIISCFFNPMNSPYRLKAFNIFYESIKHLNHKIVECVIEDAKPQLPRNENITEIHSDSLLWHKESLLNKIISELPRKYKYVFWVDADVKFTNKNWLVEGVEQLKVNNIIQPFEYCIHLEKDEICPSFDLNEFKNNPKPAKDTKIWRSFSRCYQNLESFRKYHNQDYNSEFHGHVGFAWGARREVLEQVPLYDRALIGGADHIIAHAAAGQIPHSCITNAFKDDIENVNEWSENFYRVIKGKIGYVKGDLYHIWHGDIEKRQYLKRIKDFTVQTKKITKKDHNGLYISNKSDQKYIKNYFSQREVRPSSCTHSHDDGFLTSMAIGYMSDSPLMGGLLGGNWAGGFIGGAMHDHGEPTTHTTETFTQPNQEPTLNHNNETNSIPSLEIKGTDDNPSINPDQVSIDECNNGNFS